MDYSSLYCAYLSVYRMQQHLRSAFRRPSALRVQHKLPRLPENVRRCGDEWRTIQDIGVALNLLATFAFPYTLLVNNEAFAFNGKGSERLTAHEHPRLTVWATQLWKRAWGKQFLHMCTPFAPTSANELQIAKKWLMETFLELYIVIHDFKWVMPPLQNIYQSAIVCPHVVINLMPIPINIKTQFPSVNKLIGMLIYCMDGELQRKEPINRGHQLGFR